MHQCTTCGENAAFKTFQFLSLFIHFKSEQMKSTGWNSSSIKEGGNYCGCVAQWMMLTHQNYRHETTAYCIQEVSATTEATTYCVPVCSLRAWRLKYTIINLPAVLCGCETWFVILREVHGLRVLENRVLRKMFWPKSEETNTTFEKVELGVVSRSVLLIRCSSDVIRRMR